MDKVTNNTRQVIHTAWMRDGKRIYTGQTLLLAMLMHSTGDNRDSDDMEIIRKIMRDPNL